MKAVWTWYLALCAVSCSGTSAPERAPAGYIGLGLRDGEAVVFFHDEMGPTFKLAVLELDIDRETVFSCVDDERELKADQPIRLFDGPLSAGAHELSVMAQFRGHGAGVFSYLKGYRFKVRSNHSFEVDGDQRLAVKATAYERGDATTPLEQRPDVRFQVRPGLDIPRNPVDACPWHQPQ